ncbi:DUF559 domain-containing protein [Helcobacillus massiliensis]|uniref:DUF559 domain-containing protein n=1 Tax=Helcobacillus massiliensis TaxID=521392 RepID=A0A839QSP5_9MICO|nr:hypothetical protein [Helcobacillus massiliensis]
MFHRSDAEAHGLGPHRVKAVDLRSLGCGFYAHRDIEVTESMLASAVVEHYPGAAITGPTAARIHRLPLPRELQTWQVGQPIHLNAPAGTRRRDSGLVSWSHRRVDIGTAFVSGRVVLASRVDTWLDPCPMLPLDARVVIADHLVRHPRRGLERRALPYASVEDLRAAVESRVRQHGIAAARSALALTRVGSDSPQETRCRLGCHFGRLDEPELNPVLRGAGGRWLFQPDFLWRHARLLVAYDGQPHFTSDRAVHDQDRALDLQALGFTVLRLFRDHLPAPRLHASDDQVRAALANSPAVALVRRALEAA